MDFKKIFFLATLMVTAFIYYFSNDIRVSFWHLKNPSPYVWENLEIKVPENFLVTPGGPKIHFIISPFEEVKGGIILQKHDHISMKPYGDLLKKNHFKGRGIEKRECDISGFPCYKYFVRRYSDKRIGEIVLLEKEGIEMRYIGSLESKIYFDEIIKSLKKHRPKR